MELGTNPAQSLGLQSRHAWAGAGTQVPGRGPTRPHLHTLAQPMRNGMGLCQAKVDTKAPTGSLGHSPCSTTPCPALAPGVGVSSRSQFPYPGLSKPRAEPKAQAASRSLQCQPGGQLSLNQGPGDGPRTWHCTSTTPEQNRPGRAWWLARGWAHTVTLLQDLLCRGVVVS